MISVLVCGAKGRMGTTIVSMVEKQDDMELLAGVDPVSEPGDTLACGAPIYDSLQDALNNVSPNVMVDFTRPDVAEGNLRCALSKGVNCVLGTTGLSQEALSKIYEESSTNGAALFCAPNFTTGAVLMMLFSKMAAKYFPDAEVVELHHDGKKDAPSGTAIRTAKLIAEAKVQDSQAPGKETELDGMDGARGAFVDGVYVHSVRTAGYMAHQEVIFGDLGQTLTIRHDSIDRSCYMPGVALAIRSVVKQEGLVVGLENLMD